MSSHLERLHAGFALDPGALGDIVRRAVGHGIARAERVVRGYDNEVYRVDTDRDQTLYVRISGPGADHHFAAEAAAMELARRAGVPVPEVLLLDAVPTTRGSREIMVVTAARGRPAVERWPALAAAERKLIMTRLGRVLVAVHSVAMPGVWRPDQEGRWLADGGAGYLADRKAEVSMLAPAGVDEDERGQIVAALELSPRLLGTEHPVLLHGDLNLEHVFVDGELEVSALIDWGMWCGGRSLSDLATAALSLDTVAFEALVTASEPDSLGDPGFVTELAVATIGQAVGHLAHHLTAGDPEPVGRMLRALRHGLATLSATTGEQ